MYGYGPRVKQRREEQWLTQQELAEQAGLSRASIAKIEREEIYPTRQTAEKIAAVLGVDLAKLFPPKERVTVMADRRQEQENDPSKKAAA